MQAIGIREKVQGEICWRPWGDSNSRTRLRRPVLYPLSYRGNEASISEGGGAPARRARWYRPTRQSLQQPRDERKRAIDHSEELAFA